MNNRELDLRIACDVLNLLVELVPKAWTFDDWLSSDRPTERDVMAVVSTSFTAGGMAPPAYIIPTYSTDLVEAWQVVAALERRGYWCQMRTPFQAGDEGDGYWAGFTPHGTSGWNGRPDHWTSADTLPRAICLAALSVVEAT
jgi:hypothetical protein